jgi:hypothetical protein
MQALRSCVHLLAHRHMTEPHSQVVTDTHTQQMNRNYHMFLHPLVLGLDNYCIDQEVVFRIDVGDDLDGPKNDALTDLNEQGYNWAK